MKYREEAGPVCPFLDFTRQLLKLAAAVNQMRSAECRMQNGKPRKGDFKWQHNGLRHSFISYRVAMVKNVAQVALEAGNSPQMIFSNYRELVTPQDAKAWFAITPKSVEAMRKKAEVLADGRQRQAKIIPYPALEAA
jgi:hypothetical protein